MRITHAKVIVCCPGRNFVTLKLFTDQGVYGLGDATLNGREKAVVAYLEEHCIPALIGRDARNIEDIWHYFYRGAYFRRGPVALAALSAIDLALWDIKGKALGTPLYNLLGGKSRQTALVYAHASGKGMSEALESVGRFRDLGYKAIRVQAGVPDVPDTYGVVQGSGAYEPAKRGIAHEEAWDTPKYLRFAPKLFQKARETYGDELLLLHDVHHRLTPIEAARLAQDLEPFRLFWLEDPVAAELQESLRLVRSHSTTPIAIGEVFNTAFDFTTLITEQLIDYMRMPLCHGGGITHLQKVAAFASLYHVQTGFHGATDLSPVNLAASIHFDLAINNFGIQEYMLHADIVRDVFTTNYSYADGGLTVDDTPGIGVDIDEDRAAKYPYQMASLPVARKLDGTLWNW